MREVVHRAMRLRAVASSAPLLEELEVTLERRFRITPAVAAFLEALPQQIRIVEPTALAGPVTRDPDADVVLATAMAAGAALIVTGDQDLLVLGAHAGIDIVSPRRFLEILDGERPAREPRRVPKPK